MPLKIIGAGMAGLIAANLLKHHDPIVYEVQDNLPHNHTAVLRFRSPLVGDAVGIPFRKVRVIKHVEPYLNPIAEALNYAQKNIGIYRTDRSICSEVVERYVAPHDFLDQLAKRVTIVYGARYEFDEDEKVISTIPMPALMTALKYPKRVNFLHTTGINVRATVLGCDGFASLYVPDPDARFSRVSLTGDELIVECPRASFVLGWSASNIAYEAAKKIGITADRVDDVSFYDQKFAKIQAIKEEERRDFIHWSSTLQRKAFSLGRFATWRPWLMTDDLIQDVRLIDSWIRTGYAMERSN